MQWKRTLTRCTILVTSGVLLGLGAACEKKPTDPDTGGEATPINWTADAREHRGKNGQRFRFSCPANGTVQSVWGTDVYTDDSSICVAAVHAGKITLAAGGIVTIEIRPGLSSYQGSTRNGIASADWGPWEGSFIFP